MADRRAMRLCFLGDSFVAGVGDPERRGWVGRITDRSQPGAALNPYSCTTYNLGVRRDTSTDVRRRWRRECTSRLPAGCDNRIVVSFGVNDTTVTGRGTRVDPQQSCVNLAAILDDATAADWSTLIVGPAPIGDDQQNDRIRELDRRFATLCAARDIPYVAVFPGLYGHPTWASEVRAGDGAHPSAAGYDLLAGAIREPWTSWLRRPSGRGLSTHTD